MRELREGGRDGRRGKPWERYEGEKKREMRGRDEDEVEEIFEG